MDVLSGPTDLGRLECGIANDGGTPIPGATGSGDGSFSLPLGLTATQLAAGMAEGSVTVQRVMGPATDSSPTRTTRCVTVADQEVESSPVPLPGGTRPVWR